MYAVIKTGGKQYRVEEGQRLSVELLSSDTDAEVNFSPVLFVNGDDVRSTPGQLSGAAVKAKILGQTKGPKIVGFTYKSKSNQRRRWGHRQKYSTIEITSITA